MTTTSAPDIHIQTQGAVRADEADYAREKVEAVLRHARDPVLFVRVKLSLLRDPALDRPAVVQVNVNLNGRLVRAQVSRETMREAVDEVHDRIRDRLRRSAGDWQAIRGGRPHGDEWRHGSVPTERPRYFPLPPEQRQVLRHKAFALERITVDQAAFDMELLGYLFHLFTETGTGSDSVLYRTDDGTGYRLAQVEPRPERVTAGEVAVTVSPLRPPVLRVEQAVERLTVTGWPFVFFRDGDSGRGCVLYHRYDGNYGLISPPG